jgi:hypothetical protein
VLDLTDGAYNLPDLAADPNKATCFLLQASLAGMSDAAVPALGAVGSVLGWAQQQLGPIAEQYSCPQLKNFNNALFNQFPGAKYQATGE